VVSPNELALAKATLDKAKAELALAEAHLGFTEIRAPFDGIMDRFQKRIGSLIEEGELLTTLSDNSRMWVYFNVPEAEYLDYVKKTKSENTKNVLLKMANNEQFDVPGVVETIEADFNNETGNISFRATFPNPKALLRHGETGNIVVTLPFKNAMIIPQKATFEVLDKKYVYVIGNQSSYKLLNHPQLPDIVIKNMKGVYQNDIEKIYPIDELMEGLKEQFPDSKITLNLNKTAITIDWS
jgi:membrane fusion protein (multidrug efflux system)